MPYVFLLLVALGPVGLGEELPPGVPRVINLDGSVSISPMFTSGAYAEAAFKLLVAEAQTVAGELGLDEDKVITPDDVIRCHINPFGYGYMENKIGWISTEHYHYYATQSNMFSSLVVNDYDRTGIAIRSREKVPLSQFDTNTPFLLATQWLARVSVDVKALGRECEPAVALSPFWNGLQKLGDPPKTSGFVPIYMVWWKSEKHRREGFGSSAFVELYLPEKKILQLTVKDPRYIRRKPLSVTNLAGLFPGVAKIETNGPPPPPTIVDPPK